MTAEQPWFWRLVCSDQRGQPDGARSAKPPKAARGTSNTAILRPVDKYECDHCGACCKGHLIVEAYELDVLREPRLATADISGRTRDMAEEVLMAELEQEGKCLIIAGGQQCTFLDVNNCAIYTTRPNVCVAMKPGVDQCNEARYAEGLPALSKQHAPSRPLTAPMRPQKKPRYRSTGALPSNR